MFFVSEYHRLHGGQRSLLQLARGLRDAAVAPVVLFPGEGRCSAAFRAAGIEVRILPGPDIFSTFGQGLLRGRRRHQARVFASQILPYSLRLARLARADGARILH